MTTQILHLTAHLGGGVGKVLLNLQEQAKKSKLGFEHIIVCLEEPKSNIIKIKDNDNIIISPPRYRLERMLKRADIVQLEWWNHPILLKTLCTLDIPPIRLLTWCHNNGLYNPLIPKQLIINSHTTLFTSDASYNDEEINYLIPVLEDRMGVVYSSGGFNNLPESINNSPDKLSVGYLGSTNFSKINFNYVDFISKVNIPDFKVKMIGDVQNKDILIQHCKNVDKPNLLEFTGYVPDITEELKKINVLAYILNPQHYGTTENSLLEAMAMGIVPIVLNNLPEQCIISNYETGIIVSNPEEFSEAIQYLFDNPIERQIMANQAKKYVRECFSIEKTEKHLNEYYWKVLSMKKKTIDFKKIFGNTPDQWFLSSQRNKNIFNKDGTINILYDKNDSCNRNYYFRSPILLEETKGSVFHFSKYFPENRLLELWSQNLKPLK